MLAKIWTETDRIFVILEYFLPSPLPPPPSLLTTRKNKLLKKRNKTTGDIIILHMHAKNENHLTSLKLSHHKSQIAISF